MEISFKVVRLLWNAFNCCVGKAHTADKLIINFNKMKRSLSLILMVFSFLILSANVFADTSNISNLVFTSASQTVLPNTLSTELKVQTQNSSAAAETISETNDVTFSSNSPSGEFLNSSGNVVSKTMSKNTSSRSFYYRDSTTGIFTLTVEIKGRDSGKTFSSSQDIIISNEIPTIGTSTPTTSTSTPTTATTTVITSSNVQTLSAHSSTVTITYLVNEVALKADAGRHRIATTKSPIEFEANISGENNASYSWSFGDGTMDTGKIVSHSYAFPGDYNVVLNATSGGKHAVSRTEVKVVSPEVQIVKIEKGGEGFVELKNDSPYEVNVQDWKLTTGQIETIFPQDTIIKENSSVKFPFVFIAGDTSEVTLSYTNGIVADVFGEVPTVSDTTAYNEPTREQIEEAKLKVARQFALQTSPLNQIINNEPGIDKDSNNINNSAVEVVPTSESLIDSLEHKSPEDNSLVTTPFKFFKFIKNFFTN